MSEGYEETMILGNIIGLIFPIVRIFSIETPCEIIGGEVPELQSCLSCPSGADPGYNCGVDTRGDVKEKRKTNVNSLYAAIGNGGSKKTGLPFTFGRVNEPGYIKYRNVFDIKKPCLSVP